MMMAIDPLEVLLVIILAVVILTAMFLLWSLFKISARSEQIAMQTFLKWLKEDAEEEDENE